MPQHSTPTQLRIAQGNPSQRPLPDKEPPAERGIPEMPLFLSGRAQQVWNHLAPLLLQLGTLSIADGVALEALCNQIVYMRMAQDDIEQNGILTQTQNGPRKNPAINVADGALKQVRALLGEFGLTPAARTRIRSNNPEFATELEQILGERTRLRTYGDNVPQ